MKTDLLLMELKKEIAHKTPGTNNANNEKTLFCDQIQSENLFSYFDEQNRHRELFD